MSTFVVMPLLMDTEEPHCVDCGQQIGVGNEYTLRPDSWNDLIGVISEVVCTRCAR